MAAAADEVSAEAAGVGAAVDASPMRGLEYFPTALVRDQLPVGLDALGGVPTLATTPGPTLAARVKKYALAIRRMAKVYATSEHKRKTKAQYDRVLLWLDAWSRLSGLGALVAADLRVRCSPCLPCVVRACLPVGRGRVRRAPGARLRVAIALLTHVDCSRVCSRCCRAEEAGRRRLSVASEEEWQDGHNDA